jgi:hypothetical protein
MSEPLKTFCSVDSFFDVLISLTVFMKIVYITDPHVEFGQLPTFRPTAPPGGPLIFSPFGLRIYTILNVSL